MSRNSPPRARRGLVPPAILVLLSCTPAHLPGGQDGPQGFCGDGRVSDAEMCDDGNSVAGDGCSAECQPEIPPNCGDGILVPEEGEACDDGNMDSGDGCGFGCWIEGCGNGFLDPGESCEDGNNVAGDGCSVDCKSDESCGNGIVDDVADELCDDGNADDTDSCPSGCEPARCGDGFVKSGVESCDDGNGTADDGCTECILDSCGDANMDEGEECDQGAANGSDSSSCFRTCLTTEVEMELTYGQATSPSIPYSFDSVLVADVDNDGNQDVVATSLVDQATAIILGKGDGLLASTRRAPTSISGASATALVDVNDDQILDLLIASTVDSVHILLGTNSGFELNLAASTVFDGGGDQPRDLVVADFDGDGALDIATANQLSNDVIILSGDGAGLFSASARFGTQSGNGGQGPTKIAYGDVTGDGIADLVTANGGSSDVSVLRGLGGGSFGAPAVSSTVLGAQGTNPRDLALADVTNDGLLDVITANTTSSDVTVLAQQDGELASPLAFPTFDGDAGTAPAALAVADVNKDGIPDLVTANAQDVSVLAGLGPGVAFGAPRIGSVEVVGTQSALRPVLAVGDMNDDNTLDVVVATSTSRDVRVLVGAGDGSFAAAQAFHIDIDSTAATAVDLTLGDFDGDDRIDVLALAANTAVVVPGAGDGRLLPPSIARTGSRFVALGDFDNDSDLDIAAADPAASSQLLVSIQDARRRPQATFVVPSPATTAAQAVGTGDFDRDGFLDLVGVASSTAALFDGSGDGGFLQADPSSIALSSTSTRNAAVADLSNDGILDIAVAVSGANLVDVMIGDGAGAFTNPITVSTEVGNSGRSPFVVVAADVDGEMGADIITANVATQDFSIIRSTGNGTFAPAKIVPAVFGADPAGVVSVATGDVNGDGFVDLVSANRERSTISVVLGFGNGNFAAPQTFGIVGPTGVGVGDFDRDGLDDVAVVTEDGTIAIFAGRGHP